MNLNVILPETFWLSLNKENNLEQSTASKTALITSLMRAVHARNDPQPILIDPWGDKLIPPPVIEQLKQALLLQSPDDGSDSFFENWLRNSSTYSGVITRSRYTEDALHAAIARGVRQYVIIGAGFDSYALRKPEGSDHLEIFEIDHPATQSLKKQCIAEQGVSVPDSLHFLQADLAEEKLAAVLSRSSFKSTEPTFFSWLGVTMYLTREANMSALEGIAQSGATGSELVFTYMDQRLFVTDESRPDTDSDYAETDKLVASVGESFVSGFDPAALAQNLESVGLKLEEDLDPIELVDRYENEGSSGLQGTSRSRIARARIVGDFTAGRRGE